MKHKILNKCSLKLQVCRPLISSWLVSVISPLCSLVFSSWRDSSCQQQGRKLTLTSNDVVFQKHTFTIEKDQTVVASFTLLTFMWTCLTWDYCQHVAKHILLALQNCCLFSKQRQPWVCICNRLMGKAGFFSFVKTNKKKNAVNIDCVPLSLCQTLFTLKTWRLCRSCGTSSTRPCWSWSVSGAQTTPSEPGVSF